MRREIIIPFYITLISLVTILLSSCTSYVSEEAEKEYEGLDRPYSVTIFPVNILKRISKENIIIEHDGEMSKNINQMFLSNDSMRIIPTISNIEIAYPVEMSFNQSKMAKESALAFPSKVKEIGIETEYALIVEILCNEAETYIHGVHFYL